MSRFRLALAVVAVLSVGVATGARADESVLHKGGYWTVGRGEADSPSCFASLSLAEGLFVLRADQGKVTVAASPEKPIRKGKAGSLSVTGGRIEFKPLIDDGLIFMKGSLTEVQLAAVHDADDLALDVDGARIMAGHMGGTGIADAVDAVVACSNGQDGWWGAGVRPVR